MMADKIIGYTGQVIPEKVIYTGRDTSTATTIVDNTTYEIGVEINPDLLDSRVKNEDGSIDVVTEDGISTVSVNVSADDNNMLSKKDDGLFVYLDTSDFATKEEVEDTKEELQGNIDLKQNELTAGYGLKIEDDTISMLGEGWGTLEYPDLYHKPQINGVELNGDLTNEDLHINIPDISDLATYQYVDEGLATKKDDFNISAGQGIDVSTDSAGNVTISNTQTSAEWGNIQGNINNQSDLMSEFDTKVDKRNGYSLMAQEEHTKLEGIEAGAQVNVQADWDETNSSDDAYIKNKPTIPVVNDATLTIKVNNTTIDSFSANASSNVDVNIEVPTDTDDLTNGAGYITGGTVSQPTFTGNESTITMTGTPTGTITIGTGSSGTYTPEGTISTPSFTGVEGEVNVLGTPSGTIDIEVGNGTANYTPAGSVSTPSFTGTIGSLSVTGTPSGSVSITSNAPTSEVEANYIPEGTISVTPTVELNTTTIKSITDAGTLAQCTMPTLTFDPGTDLDDNLVISWSGGSYTAGTLPTLSTDTSVATGVKTATATGSFTGVGTNLSASFSGSSLTSTGSFTPEGTISTPTFSGTGVDLEARFTGSTFTSTGTFTPTGSISQPTFEGTQAYLEGYLIGDAMTLTGTYTPSGTVSQPEFTGN